MRVSIPIGLLVLAVVTAAEAIPPLPAGLFVLAPEESRITFFVQDNRGGFTGYAREMEGRALIRQVQEWVYGAEVQVRVPARSLTTGLGLRDAQMHRGHLHPDRFPVIAFTGTVHAAGVRIASEFPAEVRGLLLLHGREREMAFPARIIPLPDGFRGRGEFVVRMSEYGIPIPRFLIFVAEDPVRVTVDLVFRRSSP
ncbi:MAG: YceI family protein [Armatimonadota bacterium]|nr:YceI family protein [Armatimonadota bacterium]MDR7444467.1 YceI family protein [Armatimonadota bacterium]MDR7570169.1 YceI family protein [Armatimonadota bacterium]MDR7615228.1 YceI family protein [Armatimonadota bacterium]